MMPHIKGLKITSHNYNYSGKTLKLIDDNLNKQTMKDEIKANVIALLWAILLVGIIILIGIGTTGCNKKVTCPTYAMERSIQ